jgi:hypothetical protein
MIREFKWLTLVTAISLAACGGGGGSNSSGSGGSGGTSGSAISNVTFATQLPAGVDLTTAKALAVTGISETSTARSLRAGWLDRLYAVLGIRSAQASTASVNGLFYLSSGSDFSRIDLLQVVNPTTGARVSISDADLTAAGPNSAPTVTGVFITPAYVLQSVKNLYKPDSTGKIDRTNAATACPILAIERSTGKVACINVTPWCAEFANCGNTFGNTSIQSNGDGRWVYVQDESQSLVQINLTDINNVIVTRLTSTTSDGLLQSVVVNEDGDAYVNLDTGVAFQNRHRIYKIAGGNVDLTLAGHQFVNCPFAGPASLTDISGGRDGNNFYFADESNRYWKVTKSGLAPDGFTSPTELVPSFSLPLTSGNNCAVLVKDGQYAHAAPDPQWNVNYVVELAYPQIVAGHTPRTIDFSAHVDKVMSIYSYSGKLVVHGRDAQGKDVLVLYTKADGVTGGMFTFLDGASGYSVLALSVTATGGVNATVRDDATGNIHLATMSTSILNTVTLLRRLDNAPRQFVSLN